MKLPSSLLSLSISLCAGSLSPTHHFAANSLADYEASRHRRRRPIITRGFTLAATHCSLRHWHSIHVLVVSRERVPPLNHHLYSRRPDRFRQDISSVASLASAPVQVKARTATGRNLPAGKKSHQFCSRTRFGLTERCTSSIHSC